MLLYCFYYLFVNRVVVELSHERRSLFRMKPHHTPYSMKAFSNAEKQERWLVFGVETEILKHAAFVELTKHE